MAISYSSEAASICQEALFQLRQDITVPSDATAWAANTPIEWWKCRVSLETALNEVISAFEWHTAITTANLGSWPSKCRNAAVYCLARECAIPIAGRIEDMKVMDALYREKLTDAKVTDLNDRLADESTEIDAVLAQIVGNFKRDDPALVTAWEVYTQRKDAVTTDSENTVNALLKNEKVSGAYPILADAQKEAATLLSVIKLAPACGLDPNYVQLKQQEYDALIAECLRSKLNAIVDAKSTSAGLYLDCLNEVKKTVDETTSDALMEAAAQCLCYAKNGTAYRYDADFTKTKLQEYQAKIAEWLKLKLDTVASATVSSSAPSSGLLFDCIREVADTLCIGSQGAFAADGLAVACARTLCYAKYGQRYGYDAQFVQLKETEYSAKILQWRKIAMDAQTSVDSVLAQLVTNFKGGDQALTNAWVNYTNRAANVKTLCDDAARADFGLASGATLTGTAKAAADCLAVAKMAPAFGLDANFSAVQMQMYEKLLAEFKQKELADDVDDETSAIYTSCLGEVKKTLGWTSGTVDDLMKACAKCLCYVRNGPRHGYEAQFIATKEQEYAAKILQWRKVQLDTSLKSNTDPVLTELVMNFKGDDQSLVNAYEVYTQRATNVKSVAEKEINVAHEWRTAFSQSSTAHPAYPAWIALCVSKLSIAMGLTADLVQVLEQKYASRLNMARVADLDAAKDALTDADTKDILSMILGSFGADAKVPRSLTDLTERIDLQKTNARRDVLLAHNWNFACVNEKTGGCQPYPDEKYRFGHPYPRCLRLVAVFGANGRLNEWRIENGMILARDPIFEIEYVKDIADVTKFPAMVKAVYLARLKALVARTVMGSAQDAAVQEQAYAKALEDAKLMDSRETNTPNEAWGDNHYADMMRGGDRRFARDLFGRR